MYPSPPALEAERFVRYHLVETVTGTQSVWVWGSPGTDPDGVSPQLAHPYRAAVLRAMERVLSSHASELDKDTASTIILLASSEMTKTKVFSRPSGLADSGLAWEGKLLLGLSTQQP